MTPVAQRVVAGASVLAASLIAWGAIAQALQSTDAWVRGSWLAVPGVSFALLAFPALGRQWWVRVAIAVTVWGLAFYGATRLYYPFGGAGRACAFSGLMAGAALSAAALVSRSPGICRNRWFFFAAGLLWAVGGALLGTGVDLNLDHPLKRPPPGRFFLLAGVVVWHLPFALLRSSQRRCLR